MDTSVELTVNGRRQRRTVDTRMSLLDFLRDALGLAGTKRGCDQGTCGACTVLVDGRRELSCLRLAAQCDDLEVCSIESGADDPLIRRLQDAFIRHDSFQCGFCTPGQIMSARALIAEGRGHSDDSVREFMSGNICRCGAFTNIVRAVREVAESGGEHA